MINIKNGLSVFFLLSLILTACEKQTMHVETGEVSDILSTTVKITGYIISEGAGLKKYGHCYSTNPDPTIFDKKTETGSTIGVGTYTSFLLNLESGTKYYARAYLSSNVATVYGAEVSFTTTN